MDRFLVTEPSDMKERGWAELDFVLISGDAYVDHPSFAPAVIGRYLESKGYRVGIIDQPDWNDVEAFKKLGKPRLASLVTAGNLDSMLNKFTAAKKIRRQDDYSPGGEAGHRPDRATLVYANRMKEAYSDVPLIIGGIEASLRRFGHYDYWSDTVRRSILVDSKADVLIYGMGELQIVELADALDQGRFKESLPSIRGICYMAKEIPTIDYVECPSFEEIKADKMAFADAFRMQYDEQDPFYGRIVVQKHGDRYLIQNTPALPLTQEEMDGVTQFDALDITFTNVGVAYSVKEEKAVLEDVTVRTNRESGFGAYVYSFPTENNGSRTSVDVAYLKEGVIVNRTNGSLDTGIIFKSSKRSVVHMEILNEDWVETEWESMIEEIDF